tara:strand:- start:1442 stop:1609 length:168 start_codon:yes stop_codon:yes gene_type:complete
LAATTLKTRLFLKEYGRDGEIRTPDFDSINSFSFINKNVVLRLFVKVFDDLGVPH